MARNKWRVLISDLCPRSKGCDRFVVVAIPEKAAQGAKHPNQAGEWQSFHKEPVRFSSLQLLQPHW